MTVETRGTAMVDADGALVPLDIRPISAEDAGRLLPRLREHIAEAKRFEQFLTDALSSDMGAKSQTERLIDGTLWQLKADATWQVTDEATLGAVLEGALARGDITEIEMLHAMEREVVTHWNHTAINSIAKRLPVVEKYRTRIEGSPRLRIKSSK